jgi:hypothetical protein
MTGQLLEESSRPQNALSEPKQLALQASSLDQAEPNPCVQLWGPGPDKATCKTCGHLAVRSYGRRYYKCDLRKMTACAATDHRVRWRACGKYVGESGGCDGPTP